MYKDLLDKAKAIDVDFRNQLDIIAKETYFSDEGKLEEATKASRKRRQAIAEIQDLARARIESERRKIAGEIVKLREAEVERRRAILGDVVLAGIYRERLAKMTSADILDAYQNAAGDWEKAIVGEYGKLIVEERAFSERPTGDDLIAYNELNVAPVELRDLEAKARDLRRGDEFVESLDLIEWRQSMADRFGLQVETLTEVEPTF